MNSATKIYTDCHVQSVYDADTITATISTVTQIDVDTEIILRKKNVKFRLFGIDAPELRGEEREKGLEARDFLRDFVNNSTFHIHTILDKNGREKRGKYGRLLCLLFAERSGKTYNVSQLLIDKGYAVFAEYHLQDVQEQKQVLRFFKK